MPENIIVSESDWREDDKRVIFAGWDDIIPPIHFTKATSLPELMVEIGAYTSKSRARQAGRTGPIPSGYTELWANKRHKVYIWNPLSESVR